MKPTAEELAGAVRDYLDLRSKGVSGWGSDCPLAKARAKVESMLAAILDEPQPQASGTVQEMRELGGLKDGYVSRTVKEICHWATELETAQQTIRDLAGTVAALQGDKRELEAKVLEVGNNNAWMQQCREYEAVFAKRKAELESQQPKSAECDWEAKQDGD